MVMRADVVDRLAADPVSRGLKVVLLAVAVGAFAPLDWATDLTYRAAPPFPDPFRSH